MTKGMLNRRGVVVIVFVSRQISSRNRRTTNPVGFAFRIQGLLEGRKHINWMLNRNFEFVEMEGIPIYVHIGVTSQSASLDELGHRQAGQSLISQMCMLGQYLMMNKPH